MYACRLVRRCAEPSPSGPWDFRGASPFPSTHHSRESTAGRGTKEQRDDQPPHNLRLPHPIREIASDCIGWWFSFLPPSSYVVPQTRIEYRWIRFTGSHVVRFCRCVVVVRPGKLHGSPRYMYLYRPTVSGSHTWMLLRVRFRCLQVLGLRLRLEGAMGVCWHRVSSLYGLVYRIAHFTIFGQRIKLQYLH